MQLRFGSTANAFSMVMKSPLEVRGQLRQSFLNSAPILFLPFSKVLFLAFDLYFRPPVEADFSAPSEPAPARRA